MRSLKNVFRYELTAQLNIASLSSKINRITNLSENHVGFIGKQATSLH